MAYSCQEEKVRILRDLERAKESGNELPHFQSIFDAAQLRPVSDAFPVANDGEENPSPHFVADAKRRASVTA